MTDPHLFADPAASLRGRITRQSLQSVLEHIQVSAWPADLVAMTGDLIQDDSAAAYERFCEMMSSLKLPVYCVPGNHDVRTLMRAALQRPEFHYCASVQIGNWLILGIDSCLANSAGGKIAVEELQRLREALDSATQDHILICLHHPPLPVGSQWLDTVGLQDATTFLDLICDHGKVRAAIFGHVHQSFDAIRDNVRIIGTPSTCRQFEPGSDKFAVDRSPPAYRRIELNCDGSIDQQLVWLDQDTIFHSKDN